MTDSQRPNRADYRRAVVLTLHHRRGDKAGLVVIVEETNAENRVPQLFRAVLVLHQTLIALLRTQSSLNLLGDWVQGMAKLPATETPGIDIVRAAQILDYHGQGDPAGIARVMNAASAEGRGTQVLLQLLDLYEVALPEISGPGGMKWLSVQTQTFIEMEHNPDDTED